MKLSTELLLTNIVLLIVIWYCAFQGTVEHACVAAVLLPLMFLLRYLSVRAAHKETNSQIEALRARIKELRERKGK